MEREVKEAMHTVFSIILISLVIVSATIFTNLSYKAYNYKVKTDAINYNIQLKSQLYSYFVNPNSDISGVDIIDFITIHDRAYNYKIVIDEVHEVYELKFGSAQVGVLRDSNGDIRKNGSGKTMYVSHSDITNQYVTKGLKRRDAENIIWTQSYITENILRDNVYNKFEGSIVKIVNGAEVVVDDTSEINGDVWLKFKMK